MANFYSDSHSERWGVLIQEKTTSCGPASVAMTEVYYKSSIVADLEGKVRALSQKMPVRFTDNWQQNLVSVLRGQGVKTYDPLGASPGAVWSYLYAYASDATPVIIQINWADGTSHAVVCVHVYKKDQHCIFLDPWYGLVEFAGSQLPTYTIGDPSGPFPGPRGKVSGWMIITHR